MTIKAIFKQLIVFTMCLNALNTSSANLCIDLFTNRPAVNTVHLLDVIEKTTRSLLMNRSLEKGILSKAFTMDQINYLIRTLKEFSDGSLRNDAPLSNKMYDVLDLYLKLQKNELLPLNINLIQAILMKSLEIKRHELARSIFSASMEIQSLDLRKLVIDALIKTAKEGRIPIFDDINISGESSYGFITAYISKIRPLGEKYSVFFEYLFGTIVHSSVREGIAVAEINNKSSSSSNLEDFGNILYGLTSSITILIDNYGQSFKILNIHTLHQMRTAANALKYENDSPPPSMTSIGERFAYKSGWSKRAEPALKSILDSFKEMVGTVPSSPN